MISYTPTGRVRAPANETVSINRTPGMVYFISGAGLIKIGWAVKPSARLWNMQRACPVKLEIMLEVPGNGHLEKTLHTRFASLRKHGEWFEPSPELHALIEEWRVNPPAPPVWTKKAVQTYEPKTKRRPVRERVFTTPP